MLHISHTQVRFRIAHVYRTRVRPRAITIYGYSYDAVVTRGVDGSSVDWDLTALSTQYRLQDVAHNETSPYSTVI